MISAPATGGDNMAEQQITPGTKLQVAFDVPMGQKTDFNMLATYKENLDARVGLYLHRPDGSEEHFYPPSEVFINTGKRLCFTPGFAFTDGEWVAEVVTQYTPNSRPYKQPRYGTLTFLVR